MIYKNLPTEFMQGSGLLTHWGCNHLTSSTLPVECTS